VHPRLRELVLLNGLSEPELLSVPSTLESRSGRTAGPRDGRRRRRERAGRRRAVSIDAVARSRAVFGDLERHGVAVGNRGMLEAWRSEGTKVACGKPRSDGQAVFFPAVGEPHVPPPLPSFPRGVPSCPSSDLPSRASVVAQALLRRRRAFDTTVMLEADMASAPNSGRSISPKDGYSTPAATGIAITL
jgi:hypothetical protein